MKRTGNLFIGLSSDTKPTTGVRVGMEFLCENNGDNFVWSGSTWLPLGKNYGPTGATGPRGATGPTGSKGATGPTGPTHA